MIKFHSVSGPNAYLSNLYPSPIVIDGVTYPTAECYRRKMGIKYAFSDVPYDHILEKVIMAKFEQNPSLADYLRSTQGQEIVYEGDEDNLLGKLLMRVREQI